MNRPPIKLRPLLCSKCGQYEVEVDEDVTAVVCPMCCAHMGPLPTNHTSDAPTGPRKPKGWKFMKVFVDSEGNVYHKGEEQTALKGTLEPTKEKPKKSRFQKEQEKSEKEKRLAERYEKKKEKLKIAEEKAAAKKTAEES